MDTLADTQPLPYIPRHSVDHEPAIDYSAKAALNARVDVRMIVIANRAAGVPSPRHAQP